MKMLVSVTIDEGVDGDIFWRINSGIRAESMGLAPVHSRGTVHLADDQDIDAGSPEDVVLALELVIARLGRLTDSAAWTHRLL
jgi:hypothetical protein